MTVGDSDAMACYHRLKPRHRRADNLLRLSS